MLKVDDLISEVLNIPSIDISDELKIIDVEEWDSMTHMILISRIEEEYNIELTGDEIAEMQNIGKIKEILSSKT